MNEHKKKFAFIAAFIALILLIIAFVVFFRSSPEPSEAEKIQEAKALMDAFVAVAEGGTSTPKIPTEVLPQRSATDQTEDEKERVLVERGIQVTEKIGNRPPPTFFLRPE